MSIPKLRNGYAAFYFIPDFEKRKGYPRKQDNFDFLRGRSCEEPIKPANTGA